MNLQTYWCSWGEGWVILTLREIHCEVWFLRIIELTCKKSLASKSNEGIFIFLFRWESQWWVLSLVRACNCLQTLPWGVSFPFRMSRIWFRFLKWFFSTVYLWAEWNFVGDTIFWWVQVFIRVTWGYVQ